MAVYGCMQRNKDFPKTVYQSKRKDFPSYHLQAMLLQLIGAGILNVMIEQSAADVYDCTMKLNIAQDGAGVMIDDPIAWQGIPLLCNDAVEKL